jgi:hypothetical protein
MTTLEERAAEMPRIVRTLPAAVCALALIALLVGAPVAYATRAKIDLLVVGKKGKVLTDQSLVTGPTSVKTSPKATCFGKGTGGDGRSTKINFPSPLGALSQAAQSTPSLKPLLVTDAFDFGLGLCGIGHSQGTKTLSWYLKVNHKNPERSGNKVEIHEGDEVLWALTGYPYPKELSLVAPEEATPGLPFVVQVFAYDDTGKRKPAKGALVTGGAGPTDSKGKTSVTLAAPASLRATDAKDLPSAAVPVCAAALCP